MSRIFLVRETEERDEASGNMTAQWEIPSSAVEVIEALLVPSGLDMSALLTRHAQESMRDECWPWAVIFFDAELPLAGHVAQLRGIRKNIAMTSYAWAKKGNSPIVPGDIPTVSMLAIRRKAILKYAAEKSPLFAPAWEALKDKPEDRKWFCISDSPPADWVKATSVGDAELFFKSRKKVDFVCRASASLLDESVRGAYALGILAYYGKKWQESASTIRSVIEAEPEMPEAWHILGASQLKLGQYDAAIHALTKAHKMEPSVIPTIGNLALAYEGKKCYGRALELFRQLQEIDPFDEPSWYHSARIHRAAGQTNRCIEACKRYLELNSQDTDAWECLYEVMRSEGRHMEVIEVCEKLTQLDPANAVRWNNLGFFLAKAGRCKEAIKHCKKALELDPLSVFAHDSLGYAHLIAREYDKAIAGVMKAIELDPNYAPAWRHLLHAYKRSGQESQFRSARDYALSMLPEEVAAVDAELLTGNIR